MHLHRLRVFALVAALLAPIALVATSVATSATTARKAKAPPLGMDAATVKFVKADQMTGNAGSGLTRGITSTTVKMGCGYDAVYPSAVQGVQAYLHRINKSKIYGRTITLEPCVQFSTTDEPGTLAAVQQMVEQQGDFGVFLFCSAECDQAVANFLGTNQVPTFSNGTLPITCGTRWGIGVDGCQDANTVTPAIPYEVTAPSDIQGVEAVQAKLKVAKSSFVVAAGGANNSAAQISNAQTTINLAAAAGYPTVSTAFAWPATTASSFAPVASQIVADNVKLLVASSGINILPTLQSALTAAGWKGVLIASGVGYIPDVAKTQPVLAATINGLYAVLRFAPPYYAHSAWVTQMVKDATAIGVSTSTLAYTGVAGYISAEMLTETLQATGKKLNTQTWDRAVNGGKFTYKPALANGPGTIPFPAGHFAYANCYALVNNNNGVYNTTIPWNCVPNTGT